MLYVRIAQAFSLLRLHLKFFEKSHEYKVVMNKNLLLLISRFNYNKNNINIQYIHNKSLRLYLTMCVEIDYSYLITCYKNF